MKSQINNKKINKDIELNIKNIFKCILNGIKPKNIQIFS